MVYAIFYMHQTSGACAGVCKCNGMHQMEKSGVDQPQRLGKIRLLYIYIILRYILTITVTKYSLNFSSLLKLFGWDQDQTPLFY